MAYTHSIGALNKCRWISKVSDSLLFVKYGRNFLNMLDVNQNTLELKSPIKLQEEGKFESFDISIFPMISFFHFELITYYQLPIGWTNWIDVCPSNNNLLATAGSDLNVKIYDRRESKIVKTIDANHTGTIILIYLTKILLLSFSQMRSIV